MIALALRPNFVVFVTDVAGVYNIPPTQPGATLLREIFVESAEQEGSTTRKETNSGPLTCVGHEHDVTGGILLSLNLYVFKNCLILMIRRNDTKIMECEYDCGS